MGKVYWTALAMCAFAANSFLCRTALGSVQIDAVSFTLIRVVAGAITLYFLLLCQGKTKPRASLWGGLALFVYAMCFSLAYAQLSTGTGALALFGSVQLCMIAYAARQGDILRGVRLFGVVLAVVGLVYLLWPKLQVPSSIWSVLCMAVSGAAWAVYSMIGRGSKTPLADTCGNFCVASVLILIVWACVYKAVQYGVQIPNVTLQQGVVLAVNYLPQATLAGVACAVASGAFASGIGYAVWYKVLPSLKTTTAACVQLSVPVIAGLAGGVFLDEQIGMRLVLSMLMTLGGIYCVLRVRK